MHHTGRLRRHCDQRPRVVGAGLHHQRLVLVCQTQATALGAVPDGTAADGLQTFRFYPVDTATGNVSEHDTTTLAGEDSTIGPSGACGVSKWLTIKMPFKAVKIS